jgi:hypothetical protein
MVPLSRLARCAAASMPRASPETNGEAGLAELVRDPLGEFQPRTRSVADDRHHRQRQRARIAADGDQRRRIVDHLQARRIVGFAQRHQGDAEFLCSGKLALGVGARANLHCTTGAAPARQ